MEKKSSPGKYILMFEPIYARHQFAVSFTPSDETIITKVKKYTEIPCDFTDKKIKKNLLGDIDKKLTALSGRDEFFEKYVDPSIFRYYGTLHKIFIGYKRKEGMSTFPCIFNNPELHSKLSLLDGSKINDPFGIQSFIDLILKSEDRGFLRFINQASEEEDTKLSSTALDLANRLRAAHDYMEGCYEQIELKALLEDKLTYYKEYREMFLLKQGYLEHLEDEKIRLQEARERASKYASASNPQNPIGQDSEQISMFDDLPVAEQPKTKKKGTL